EGGRPKSFLRPSQRSAKPAKKRGRNSSSSFALTAGRVTSSGLFSSIPSSHSHTHRSCIEGAFHLERSNSARCSTFQVKKYWQFSRDLSCRCALTSNARERGKVQKGSLIWEFGLLHVNLPFADSS